VSEVEASLYLSQKRRLENNDFEDLLTLVFVAHKANPESWPLEPELLELAEERVGKNLEISKVEDGHNEVSIFVGSESGKRIQQLSNMVKGMSMHSGQREILFQSSLISAIVFLELTISRLLHCHITEYPDSASIKDKPLSLEEIRSLGTLEEAEKYLIDREVESIMFSGLSGWTSYFKKKIKLPHRDFADLHDDLVEISQRRNLLVHNGGIVNSIYLRNVHSKYTQGVEVGDKIEISREYIDGAITIIELVGAYFILEMWKKAIKICPERVDTVMGEAYLQMLDNNWRPAKYMFRYLLSESGIQAESKLMSQINYWQCMKWNGEYEEIKTEMENADFSAYSGKFQLALAALKSDKDAFFSILDSIVPSEIQVEDVLEWPLFREMRGYPEFDHFAAKHGVMSDAEVATSVCNGEP